MELLLLLESRTTAAVVVAVLLLVQTRMLLLIISSSGAIFPAWSYFQPHIVSGRRTTRSSSAADAATRSGTDQAASLTRSNRAPASGGGRSTTDYTSARRGQGSGVSSVTPASPTQERENEAETKIEQHLAVQERELGAVVKSLTTVLKEVSNLSQAVSQIREILLQIADAINQDLQLVGPAADGVGANGHSQRKEISLAKDSHKAWNKRGAKNHWVVLLCVNLAMVDISVLELRTA